MYKLSEETPFSCFKSCIDQSCTGKSHSIIIKPKPKIDGPNFQSLNEHINTTAVLLDYIVSKLFHGMFFKPNENIVSLRSTDHLEQSFILHRINSKLCTTYFPFMHLFRDCHQFTHYICDIFAINYESIGHQNLLSKFIMIIEQSKTEPYNMTFLLEQSVRPLLRREQLTGKTKQNLSSFQKRQTSARNNQTLTNQSLEKQDMGKKQKKP